MCLSNLRERLLRRSFFLRQRELSREQGQAAESKQLVFKDIAMISKVGFAKLTESSWPLKVYSAAEDFWYPVTGSIAAAVSA